MNYYNKYQKYKNKYLNSKEMSGGADISLVYDVSRSYIENENIFKIEAHFKQTNNNSKLKLQAESTNKLELELELKDQTVIKNNLIGNFRNFPDNEQKLIKEVIQELKDHVPTLENIDILRFL